MSIAEPRHGEVWVADVPDDKRRPVLVLTRDPLARILRSIICAPVTSTVRDLITEVPIGQEAGLSRVSVVNLDNTFLLGRRDLVQRLGRADESTMEAACRALSEAIGC
jgi:mRNA interferase MazF